MTTIEWSIDRTVNNGVRNGNDDNGRVIKDVKKMCFFLIFILRFFLIFFYFNFFGGWGVVFGFARTDWDFKVSAALTGTDVYRFSIEVE